MRSRIGRQTGSHNLGGSGEGLKTDGSTCHFQQPKELLTSFRDLEFAQAEIHGFNLEKNSMLSQYNEVGLKA